MNDKFQINCTLKQHTPLIHFQHEQAGATLRATELKPKLDKFILTKLGNGNYDQGCQLAKANKWLVGKGEHNALDYKVKIIAKGEIDDFRKLTEIEKFDRKSKMNKWVNERNFPHLLANMGGKEKKSELKNFAFNKSIELIITCFSSNELLNKIKEDLPKVFEKENFGNRKSKGFGSFSVIKINDEAYNSIVNFPYKFDWEVNGQDLFEKQKNLFEAIDYLYKTLRSGINFGRFDRNQRKFIPQFYFKSILRDYAENVLGEQWDKKTIKEKYFVGNSTEGRFIHRDFLGLSTEESWGETYNRANITKDSSTIERLTSPIIFKPIHLEGNRYRVWIDVREIQQEFKNSRINIKKDGNGNLQLQPSPKLKLPLYLDYAFREIDIEEHINKYDTKGLNGTGHWIYRKYIARIYQSIHNNLQ